jgi:hypothetical protein
MPYEKAPSSGAFLPLSLMHILSGEPMHDLSGVDSPRKATAQHGRSLRSKLSIRIPPARKIHFARPRNDGANFQKPLDIQAWVLHANTASNVYLTKSSEKSSAGSGLLPPGGLPSLQPLLGCVFHRCGGSCVVLHGRQFDVLDDLSVHRQQKLPFVAFSGLAALQGCFLFRHGGKPPQI